jgi:prepilin-type N-terminal cleavage/methylation domain-containing protein
VDINGGRRSIHFPGFTFIEMMAVVTIIGILLVVIAAKYDQTLVASKEAATKGNLASLRGSLSIYYCDTDGQYPANIQSLNSGKRVYFSGNPEASMPKYHPETTSETDGSSGTVLNDAGGWAYVNDTKDTLLGSLWVNCTHTDTKGTTWNLY